MIAGNGCYNLVGDPEAIRRCIAGRAAAAVSGSAKAKVIVARGAHQCDDSELSLLDPEIATHHAVVNRMKASSGGRLTADGPASRTSRGLTPADFFVS
jgi:hypothetical protein